MKNIKESTLFIAVTIICVICLVFTAAATWEKVNEESSIEYYFDEITSTLHINGVGKIPDDFCGNCSYVEEDDSWDIIEEEEENKSWQELFCPKVKTLIIGEGITEIGHCAFMGEYGWDKNFCNLEAVILPESLENIGNDAFAGCEKLTKINLPSNLKKIGSEAFAHTGIKNISLPASLKTISPYAFSSSDLVEIYIPENVEVIGKYAFKWCRSLKKVTFTNAVCTVINCESLEEIVYPADFTDFNRNRDDLIASACPNLKKITFPSEEKKHNIKISVEDYGVFVKDCPNVTLGYVNFDMIKNQYIDYAVITELPSKLDKAKNLKHTQKGNDNKITWSPVKGAGYYKLYRKNDNDKDWVRVYCGSQTEYEQPVYGEYKVRAVSYDGEKYVYGKYSDTIEVYPMYRIGLVLEGKTDNSATLRWSNTAGQTGFQLYYSTSKKSGYKKAVDTTKRKYTVKNLKKGETYYFKVRRYYKYADGNIAYGPFDDIVKVKI